MTSPCYEIYAIRYAEPDGRRSAHFVGGDPHDAPRPMDYFVWLVTNAERTLVVDTGFSAASAGPGLERIAVRLDAEPAH